MISRTGMQTKILFDFVFDCLCRLELDCLGCRNLDLFACGRVDTLSGRLFNNNELAETGNSNFAAILECCSNFIKYSIDCCFGIFLCQSELLSDSCGNVLFGTAHNIHGTFPP